MKTAQAVGEGLTFEKVWAMMQAANEQIEATDRQISKVGNRFGEINEYMAVPNLVVKFREIGFEVTKTRRNTEAVDREHDSIMEVDAFLENGDKVMIVEIKSKPCARDVDDHVERMEKPRRYVDLHDDKQVYLDAIGGAVFNENEKIYALKKGFYALEPSGEMFKIIKPKGKDRLREWQPAPRVSWQAAPAIETAVYPPPTCLQKLNQQHHRKRQAAKDCPQNAP
ncbi:MAG: hypothetical protein LBK73_08000 [Treponema sp.]|jgi:hypothetical protein|nr:hypothetical protein [Treponema sp.]